MKDTKERLISAEAFGAHLKKLRQLRQLSRREVAGQLGISESAYASWEQGRRDPGIADLLKLMSVLKIDPRELFWK